MSKGNILVSQPVSRGLPDHVDMDSDVFDKKLDRDLPEHPTSVSPFRYRQTISTLPAADQVATSFGPRLFIPPTDPSRVWDSLTSVTLDPRVLEANHLIGARTTETTAATFDILRTRVLQAMQENGWTRLAITAPTVGCGSSFVAANLALSLARKASSRTLLVDLELRSPALARMLGISAPGNLRDLLQNDQPIESLVMRVGQNLALALNSTAAQDAAEVLLEPETVEALEALEDALRPDLVLFDMPPALSCDDVIAFLPQVDAVLLVTDGSRTLAADVTACEQLFEGNAPLLGIVLNRAEDRGLRRFIHPGITARKWFGR